MVAASARRFRQAQGRPPGHRRARQPLPAVAQLPWQPLPPRRATWLVLRRATKRTEAAAHQLPQLHAQSRAVAAAIALAQDFATLVRQRQPERLAPWRKRATTRAVDAVRRVATGRYEDDEAVKAGGTLPWNAGPVEGHMHRRKMFKRQRLGRARLDLLRRRCGLAPRARRTQAAGPRVQPQVHAVATRTCRGAGEHEGRCPSEDARRAGWDTRPGQHHFRLSPKACLNRSVA